jgi:hypothetical protein
MADSRSRPGDLASYVARSDRPFWRVKGSLLGGMQLTVPWPPAERHIPIHNCQFERRYYACSHVTSKSYASSVATCKATLSSSVQIRRTAMQWRQAGTIPRWRHAGKMEAMPRMVMQATTLTIAGCHWYFPRTDPRPASEHHPSCGGKDKLCTD